MNGRDDKKSDDLFYTCSLIEYIARKTRNRPDDVVRKLGRERIAKIYDLADVYHSDNIDRVADDFIAESGIMTGTFDNVAECHYAVPSHWDIGKVYKRLILMAARDGDGDVIGCLMDVYTSPMVDLIEDYNSSFYYDSPAAIYDAYTHGCVPE